jgi:hypothetical protein
MCFNGKEEKKIQIKMSSIRITRLPLDIFAEQVRFVISVSHTLIDGHLALTRWAGTSTVSKRTVLARHSTDDDSASA